MPAPWYQRLPTAPAVAKLASAPDWCRSLRIAAHHLLCRPPHHRRRLPRHLESSVQWPSRPPATRGRRARRTTHRLRALGHPGDRRSQRPLRGGRAGWTTNWHRSRRRRRPRHIQTHCQRTGLRTTGRHHHPPLRGISRHQRPHRRQRSGPRRTGRRRHERHRAQPARRGGTRPPTHARQRVPRRQRANTSNARPSQPAEAAAPADRAAWADGAVPAGGADPSVGAEPESVGSAHATPTPATAAPTPNANANAPTRPTCLAAPIAVPLVTTLPTERSRKLHKRSSTLKRPSD